MKRILFVNTDLRGGGAEKILVNIANGFDYSKYEITVLTIFKEGINREFLNKKVIQKWIFKTHFKGYSRLALLFSPKFLFKRFIKSNDYDVIISFLEGFPSRIVSGCEDEHTKLISWIHLELYNDTIGYEFRSKKEAEKCYNKFDRIVSVASTVKHHFSNSLKSIPQEKLEVIYNPLNIDEILNKSIINPYHKINKIRFVTVGRLNPQKGYDRLLRVLKRIKSEGFDFELNILGIGPMETELKRFAADNNLSDVVKFLGFQLNPYPYIRYADLFVCSSRKEGYSTVVTESIILETPVITTNCSGMEEILDNGNVGIIVDNNEQALYTALRDIIEDASLLIAFEGKIKERAQLFRERNSMNEILRLVN